MTARGPLTEIKLKGKLHGDDRCASSVCVLFARLFVEQAQCGPPEQVSLLITEGASQQQTINKQTHKQTNQNKTNKTKQTNKPNKQTKQTNQTNQTNKPNKTKQNKTQNNNKTNKPNQTKPNQTKTTQTKQNAKQQQFKTTNYCRELI
jgi:hypothetical protein